MSNSPLHFNTMVYQIFSLICSEVYQVISHKMIFVIHDALWPHRSSVFLSVKLEAFLKKKCKTRKNTHILKYLAIHKINIKKEDH